MTEKKERSQDLFKKVEKPNIRHKNEEKKRGHRTTKKMSLRGEYS